jgi:hypothetical protein
MRRLGSIDSVSIVLAGLARRLGLESKLLESRLRRNWVSIVGEPIASNTWPDQIRYKKLYLLVHNSVWLHQLTFSNTLLHKLHGSRRGTHHRHRVARGRIPHGSSVATTLAVMASPHRGDINRNIAHAPAIQDPDLRLRFTEVISRYPQAPTPPGWGPSRVP